MQYQYGDHITHKDVLSSAMYPAVFKDFQDFRYRYGDKITKLPTRAFLSPLKEDEEISVEMGPGSEVRTAASIAGSYLP
jgi:pyruvate carboxylase